LLQYSVFFYHGWKFIEYLGQKGCNINKQDKNGKTAMLEAAYLGYVRNVQYLLKLGARTDLKSTNMFDMDAIEAAAFKNKVKVIFLFLKLKIVTVQQLKQKAELKRKLHKIELFNPELIKKI
jgi:ankyrin repeat protein